MKKNKLLKTGALALGTVASIAAPIAAVVSCGAGYQGRFEQANDGVVKILTEFAQNGQQAMALDTQIAEYNKQMKNKPGYVKVESTRIDGGYGALTSTLETKFEAGDTKTLPNLVIGYADTLGAIAKYDMQQNMEDVVKAASKDADGKEIPAVYGKALRNGFEEKFAEENDQIGGLDGSKGTFLVPLAKSTDVLNVNKEVIAYLAKTIADAKGASFTITAGSKLDAMVKAAAAGDQTAIAGIWGDVDKTKTDILKNIVVDDTIFDSYDGLLNFAAQAQSLFKKTTTDKDLHVLGEDSAPSLLYEIAYAILGTKKLSEDHSFLFNKNGKYVEHAFKDPKTVEGKAFAAAYKMMKPALANGGLFFNDSGAYSSQYETKHKIGMALGSTAGYSHNFIATPGTVYTFHDDEKGTDVPMQYISEFTPAASVTNGILGTVNDGSHTNNLVLSSATKSTYDVQISPSDDAKVQAFIKAHPTGVLVSSDANASKVPGAIQVTEGKYAKYMFVKDGTIVKSTVTTADDTLQEAELEVMRDPGSIKAHPGKHFVFSQGPSILGLHANDVEDAGAREFMKWFITGSTKIGLDPADKNHERTIDFTVGKTPISQFNKDAGYIDVTKGAFAQDTLVGGNPATQMAYEEFKKAVETDAQILTNPVDDTTAALRVNLDAALVAQYNLRAKGKVNDVASLLWSVNKIYGTL